MHPTEPPDSHVVKALLQAAAALLFINFVLSLASGYFTNRAVAEIKQKQAGRGGGLGCCWEPLLVAWLAHRAGFDMLAWHKPCCSCSFARPPALCG